AYLVMMAIRLVELHRVLKDTGSLYLHCDPTASHYLKMVLDQVFGPQNFRNEIVWKRTTAHSDPERFGRVHDIILFYSKTATPAWNTDFAPYDPDYVETYYRYTDKDGRKFLSRDLTAPSHGGSTGQYEWRGKFPPKGRMWSYTKENMERLEADGRIFYTKNGYPRLKQYLEDMPGMPAQSIWTDIVNIRSWHKEDQGYDTQKPLALLERIIAASSNEGDVVLDPFCGCGTALVAAQKLNRRWIGIDITHLAIAVMKSRLEDTFPGIQFEVVGEPEDVAGAKALARQDRYQFQWWALSRIKAKPFPEERRKGADKGIDGVIDFVDREEATGKEAMKRAVVSVKSGHVHVKDIRELKDIASRHAMGVFVTLEPHTREMRTEAVSAGSYHSPLWNKDYPKVQILTIEELLQGKAVDMPSATSPYARAPRVSKKEGEQLGLNNA
ncbi:MAG: site-specific DNA-methyltransferase, partial [Dehalococcoidia bacterium]|nr:site-specific DNA-methyltransferase [Dehalococcoidia bacterium]